MEPYDNVDSRFPDDCEGEDRPRNKLPRRPKRNNVIDLLVKYSQDIYPVESMTDVGRLIYVLRQRLDFEIAESIERWKFQMERHIEEEFDDEADADTSADTESV